MNRFLPVIALFLFSGQLRAQTNVVSFGSTWKYLDNGSNQGTAWHSVSFADGAWASGNAPLGYGDGDEATVVSYGPNAKAKYTTTYFRKAFTVADTTLFRNYVLGLKRDDGAVVYLNGVEIFRSNLTAGTVSYTTKALTDATDDGNTIQYKTLSLKQVKSGLNTLAVEVHQRTATGDDLSFDCQLQGIPVASPGAVLTRGPYLNSALSNGIVIRWRTDIPTTSEVSYGSVASILNQNVVDNSLTTEHEVKLTGLVANHLYYYSIGTSTQILQGDGSNFFKTLPGTTSVQRSRFLVMGDMGNNSTNQKKVRDSWITFNGTKHLDGWILLGDNAYNSGTDAEYQANFFNIYQGTITKNHVLWPAPGNHDYANNAARQADHAIPYYSMFTLPTTGEAGGLPSGTEAYYSHNHANIHFVALDSYGWETGNTRLYDTLGPQATWLKADLAQNTKPWTIVYFHHPPYTKTSHNSDAEAELINMRQRLVPILERYKVDLVLCGHSHGYERSYPIQGHYGLETTFSLASHALSGSSGKYDGSANSCTYVKNAADVRNGVVYAVVGSAGQLGGTSPGYPHDAMYYSNTSNGGALYLEIENNRLIGKWIGADSLVRDYFTIMKNVNKTSTVSITNGSSTTLTASWLGSYYWSTGARTRKITVSPLINTTYTVTDGKSCLTDLFNVQVLAGRRSVADGEPDDLVLSPNPVPMGDYLQVGVKDDREIRTQLMDLQGKILKEYRISGSVEMPTNGMAPGLYLLKTAEGIHRFQVVE